MNHYRFGSFTSRSAQAIDQSASAMPRQRTKVGACIGREGPSASKMAGAARLKSDPETG